MAQGSDHVEKTVPPPPLVAAASWVLPGLGYLLIGHRKRAAVVGPTILLLFVLGLLIGGVRVLEAPGYGPNGGRLVVVQDNYLRSDGTSEGRLFVEEDPRPRAGRQVVGSALRVQPLSEVRDKPWSVPQLLNGPVGILGMAWSVWASAPAHGAGGEPPAVPSHARVYEIGVLYTAVAGMLNLLAIIDAASRAAAIQEKRAAAAAAGVTAPAGPPQASPGST